MPNPYVPPATGLSEEKAAAGIKNWNRRQWITALASLIAIVVLAIVSLALIAQALRLNSESASLPRAFEWTTPQPHVLVDCGIAAIAGVLLNAGGLMLVRKNKLTVPMTIIATTIMGMIVIASSFKTSVKLSLSLGPPSDQPHTNSVKRNRIRSTNHESQPSARTAVVTCIESITRTG